MALNNPPSGYFNSSEFTASSLPWVVSGTTSGTDVIKYAFPKVTKNIIVHNLESSSKKLRIGFTANGVNGVGGNFYFIVDSGDLITFDSRVTEVYVRADTSNTISFSLYAGLTTIAAGQMPTLTGSLGDGSPGWTGVG
jgi:hypothetical protein